VFPSPIIKLKRNDEGITCAIEAKHLPGKGFLRKVKILNLLLSGTGATLTTYKSAHCCPGNTRPKKLTQWYMAYNRRY
jgi:hypothetical protein